jgi:hypothetical protein
MLQLQKGHIVFFLFFLNKVTAKFAKTSLLLSFELEYTSFIDSATGFSHYRLPVYRLPVHAQGGRNFNLTTLGGDQIPSCKTPSIMLVQQ